jgi:hypothetical protein
MMRLLISPRPLARGCVAGLALLALLAATACERVAPIRTLPSWVRGVYIPVFKNKTFDPALEETATKLTAEAFLADGRVDIVPKSDADLTVVVEITKWDERASGTSGDKITDRNEYSLTASIKLFEPFDADKPGAEPLADLGRIKVDTEFNIDARSTFYVAEPDRKEQLLRALADQVLYRTINGFPTNLRNLPPGATLPEVKGPETIKTNDVLEPRQRAPISY